MKIRGELSIMGCVLVLCHNCTYGRTYFRMLFTNTKSLSAAQMTAAIISLVLITIMLILTVTSFPQVRKKMNAVKWKSFREQRTYSMDLYMYTYFLSMFLMQEEV